MALIRCLLLLYTVLALAKATHVDAPIPTAVAATWQSSDESSVPKLKAAPLTPSPTFKLLLADKPWLSVPAEPVTFVILDTSERSLLKPTPYAYSYRCSGLSPPTLLLS